MAYAASRVTKACSFDGIRFPILSCRIKGAMRNHEHVYPHSPGAAVEKLGRDLYKIEIIPCFQDNLIPPEYEGIWPQRLSQLRDIFDSGKTADLILPTVGKMRAMATQWEQEFNPAKSVSGESVSWNFIEDQENARLLAASFVSSKGLAPALESFKVAGQSLNPKPSYWDMASEAVASVLAYKDQIDLYSNLVESKLQSALSMFNSLSDQVSELSNPRNAFALEALTELWAQTAAFHKDQKQTGMRFKHRKTTRLMDIGQVAVWLYGDSEKASDILSLNAFADPYAIPMGTDVRYYETRPGI